MTTPFKFQFNWCPNCAYLKECYFQHGVRSGPDLLEPACAEGPARDEHCVSNAVDDDINEGLYDEYHG
jgi:hypothetical protein